ncbi:MAG TPA: isoleucine--tRNA ligase, partial [Terriglobia bacterium]|nr:isoleucine--tRNA ligase [Terriglobia bacterium]
RGRKSIYWCIADKTALAEAEVEYESHRSRSIYVKYRLVSDAAALDPALAGRTVWVIIWTTTPWTLPASMAVAFHPNFEYVVVADADKPGDAYLVESRRLDPVLAETELHADKVLARIRGSKLEQIEMQHPFLDRRVPGVLADYVTAEDGTGAVHTAPGHGREDYQTGVKYGLEIYCPVDEEGKFTEGLPEYNGKGVFDSNEAIIKLLESRGTLAGRPGWLTHSYPHCWRCHNPIIFRASDQWFIDIDHDHLRERALEAIKTVRWSPEWGEVRISNMVATRPDWCISRQRVWGVPITVFYCESCGKPLLDAKLARPAVELFRTEGADAWYTHSIEELAAPGVKCPNCGGTRLRKELDILDVWFDSGSSQAAVLGHRPDVPWPADVYLEGADQYRGWFHSSLLVALGTRGAAPYRQVVTHGWMLDAEGRAMSKSLGTGVDPSEVIASHGAEVLRLWVASVDFREDMVMSPEILTRISEAYFKLRNTFRYCLSNLYDFDPDQDAVVGDQLLEIDAWALVETSEILEAAAAAYADFAFHKVYRAIYDFATVGLSAFYFDILKDRLYTSPARSLRRRSAQTALYRIVDALARAVAPLMCFTAEEVWSHLPSTSVHPRESSVHLATFAEPESLSDGIPGHVHTRLENWPQLIAVRNEVLKALETARQAKQVRGSLEARVVLSAGGGLGRLLEEYRAELPFLFIVSQIELAGHSRAGLGETQVAGLRLRIERAAGRKCAR